MLDKTNKQRGNCGLGIAIGYFSTNGYTVSIPLNDTQEKNKSTLNLCDKYKKYKLN